MLGPPQIAAKITVMYCGVMEPLRQFLVDNLAASPVTLRDGEMLSEALVLYRVVNIDSNDERYGYTTTIGLPYAMAIGMLSITDDILSDVEERPDGDDD